MIWVATWENVPSDKHTKRRLSLRISVVWSASSMSARKTAASLAIYKMHPVKILIKRLIWIFTGLTWPKELFLPLQLTDMLFLEFAMGQITVFTLSIGTPYLLTILVLKFEIIHSTITWCVLNIAVCMANSVDPNQTPGSAALVYTACKGIPVPILRVLQ